MAKTKETNDTAAAATMPRGLGYAAKRKWLTENGRADEAEAMRLAANAASRKSRGGENGTMATLLTKRARLEKKTAELTDLTALVKELKAEVKELEKTLAKEQKDAATAKAGQAEADAAEDVDAVMSGAGDGAG